MMSVRTRADILCKGKKVGDGWDDSLTAYYHWLCDIVRFPGWDDGLEGNTYYLLLKRLFQTQFYWSVRNDSNRAKDGLALREEWVREESGDEQFLEKVVEWNCSVLEMLVGLARRIDFQLAEPGFEDDRTGVWFWAIIGSSGLGEFKDEEWFDYNCGDKVDVVLEGLLSRAWGRSGTGSWFGKLGGKKDWRKVEIWYLMHEWLAQNCEI